MSPQTCANCGSELAPGQRFCPGCGTPVAAAPTEAVTAPPPKRTPRRGRRLLLVGGGCLVLLACICMALLVVGSLPSDRGVATVEPIETLEPVEAWEPVEVVSERELTPEEFFQRVEGDERFAEVYALASQQGYTQPETGVEAIMSDGSVLAILPLSSPQGETIAALRLEGDERSNSLLARLEGDGEAVVLYDRQGWAEISDLGIKVFDAAGNPIGETEFQESSRRLGLARALQQQQCTGGEWDDFDHCTKRTMGMPGKWFVGGYGGAIGACFAPGGFPACLGAIVPATPYLVYCLYQKTWDAPPTVAVKTLPLELQPPCETKCVTVDGQQGVLTIRKWKIQVDIDDDRAARPPTPRFVEVCSGSGEWLEPVVEDCSGQEVPFYVEAPPPDARVGRDFEPCREGETCPRGQNWCRGIGEYLPPTITFGAEPLRVRAGDCAVLSWEVVDATTVWLAATAGGSVTDRPVAATGRERVCPTETTIYTLEAEGPGGEDTETVTVEVTAAGVTGVCSTPGAQCVVEGEFDSVITDPRGDRTAAEVNISFPVDGGPVSGDYHYGLTMDEGSEVSPCIKRFDWSGTLSGHFDPESGRLEGPVEDATSALEVEGCEGQTVYNWYAISWWATYDWTTGELKGAVEFEHEGTKVIYEETFHGIAVEE